MTKCIWNWFLSLSKKPAILFLFAFGLVISISLCATLKSPQIITGFILFNSLSKEDIHKIIDIELAKLFARVDDLGFKIQLTNEAKDYIANKGFDKEYGARPLKRAIQKYLEDALAEEILTSKLAEGDTVKVDYDEKNSEIKMKVTKAKKKTAKKEDQDSAE